MQPNHKAILISGVVLLVASCLYIMSASVPNDAISAFLFPTSILGVFFGIIFIVWAGFAHILKVKGIKLLK